MREKTESIYIYVFKQTRIVRAKADIYYVSMQIRILRDKTESTYMSSQIPG